MVSRPVVGRPAMWDVAPEVLVRIREMGRETKST